VIDTVPVAASSATLKRVQLREEPFVIEQMRPRAGRIALLKGSLLQRGKFLSATPVQPKKLSVAQMAQTPSP